MTIHITPTFDERQSALTRRQHANGGTRKDSGLKFGKSRSVPKGSDARALEAEAFQLVNAPAGARLVPFSELELGQCQWGLNHGDANLFCGLPDNPAAKDSKLFARYCSHHGSAARGRTVVR